MAGSRPSQFKKAGGFLNDVDGVVTNYEFTTEYPGVEASPKKKKDSDFNPLYMVLSVKVDGAEEPITTTLFAGSADDFEIEDDGHTLSPVEDNGGLSGSSDVARLIASAVESEFPEDELPDDQINLECFINKRFRFGQEIVVDRKTGKPRQRVVKKGKFAGKSFDVTRTIITRYYGEAEVSNAKGKSKDKPAAGKSKKADVNEALYEVADEALLSVLKAAKDNSITKAKLSAKLLNALLKHKNREAIRQLMLTDEYLDRAEGWSYDNNEEIVTLD